MKLHSIPLKHIKISDSFWSKHVALVKDAIIPYQWQAMNDLIPDAEPSHCLDNFRIAAGQAQGQFYGMVFQDTDIAKWLEAVGFTLAAGRDAELEQTADEVIDLIAAAQCGDGYLNTYFTIKEPKKRWSNLCEGHELYTAGHLIEAACAYYQGTGKRKFLDVMCRMADYICNTFGLGETQLHGYPGHQEIELALMKLYDITGEQRYLATAKYFIDIRGVGENYFLQEMRRPGFVQIFPEFKDYLPLYSQSHLPVRKQTTAEGHAVRAVYMYCAMADLAEATGDDTLLQSCKTLWDNMTQKRMYITGGIGSSGLMERFTADYDLPNDCNYAESCASIGLALFGMRMANITREAHYVDVVERALYNTVLAGIALDGKGFFYVNPLEVWPENCLPRTSKEHVKPVRQKWFGVACCPPNIARTLASIGQYIYAADDTALYLNLFVSNEATVVLRGQEVRVRVQTKFPAENSVTVTCENVPEAGFCLAVRIPDYAKDYNMAVNGKPVQYRREKGYAMLTLICDSTVAVSFAAPARFVHSNPDVRADAGRVAIVRGPQVYCLEQADNGSNLAGIYADAQSAFVEELLPELGGAVGLTCKGKRIKARGWCNDELYGEHPLALEDVTLKAVPYAYWGNRGQGELCVWLKELV